MTRKTITLPSGGSCVIRRMSAGDLALAIGDIPVLDSGEPRDGQKTMNPMPGREPKVKDSIERNVSYMQIALTRCCSPITTSEGKRLRIVDKDLDKMVDGEIAVGEIPDEDAMLIYKEVAELSGMRKEDAAQAATFPEKQESA